MNSETKEFISTHLNADVHQLALQAGRFPLVDMALAIRQINGMQKIKTKVPLFLLPTKFFIPPNFHSNNRLLNQQQLTSQHFAKETH